MNDPKPEHQIGRIDRPSAAWDGVSSARINRFRAPPRGRSLVEAEAPLPLHCFLALGAVPQDAREPDGDPGRGGGLSLALANRMRVGGAFSLRHDGDRVRGQKACGTEPSQITLDPPEGTP
jgi:hypothetical protein